MKPLLTALTLLILVAVPAYAETFPLIGKALVCVDEHENPEESPLADENDTWVRGKNELSNGYSNCSSTDSWCHILF